MRTIVRPRDDSGMAMVLVVGTMMTLMVLVLGGLAYSMQSTKFSRYDQDYTAAMAAAQSGVEDYISRLNRNDTYHASTDCSNIALKGPMTTVNSCGWTSTTPVGWVTVAPGAPADSPRYHYSIDARAVNTQGTIIVTSTGRSRDVFRTIEVAVGKGGSTDYVYYTDFESADPANKISYKPANYPSGVPEQCGGNGSSKAKYFWQSRSGCSEIQFISSDTLNGRVFSNDAILSNGATFEKGIESANTSCQSVTATGSTWRNCLRSGSSGATFGVQPKYSSALYLPDNSGEFASYPGCHYYGATRVIFSAAGTMTVWSPDSNFTGALLSVAPPGGSAPNCGTGSALASPSGASVNVPNDMVIYVAAAPSNVPRRQLYGNEIGGPTEATKLPLGSFSAAAANPTVNSSYKADINMTDATRFKGEGNLYVEGTVKGRVTVAAAQSVIVTGDVVLAGGIQGSDIVGLVATNSVEVMHPRMLTYTYSCTQTRNNRCQAYGWVTSNEDEAGNGDYASEGDWPKRYVDPTTGSRKPSTGVQIAGSIQTLQHSFFVQQYDKGPNQGTLLVSGSIAQRWRGAVGTGSITTGYSKLYQYDGRLQYTAPPYFPHWANSEWSLRYSGEITTTAGIKNG